MIPVRIHDVHRTADSTKARRTARKLSRLLRGGAAGIAGVLLAAGPTWGAGRDAAHQAPHEQAGAEALHSHGYPSVHGDRPWIPEPPLIITGGLETSGRAPDGVVEPAAWEGSPGSWAHPVAASQVSAAYGIPGSWVAGHHTGIDFAVPVGTPVRSIGAGEVVQTGWGGDYGNIVTVRMADGHYVLFAHLSKISVSNGEKVSARELLGYSGNTGRSSGPHLHFEVRRSAAYGSDVDPVSYLASKGVRI